MTTTMPRTETTTRTPDALNALMQDALAVAAVDDTNATNTDPFDGGRTAGRTLLALAALARQAAGALGADPGITVKAGPGVVVVREFAAAVRLLDRASAEADGSGSIDGLLGTAKALHAQLHEAVARAA
jgi:hypothetical protein